MKMFFVIAVDKKDTSALEKMKVESDQYHDMLVIDLQDHKEKHCHKTLGFLEHFLTQCYNHKNVDPYRDPKAPYANAPFYMKLTDDVLLFPDKLYKTIEILLTHESRRFCAGSEIWFDHNFVSGSGYLITNKAAKEIFEDARCMTSVSYMDDLTITADIR